MALRPNRPQSRPEQLAERKNAERDVLLREVDEAVREDDMRLAVKRWGGTIVGLLVLVVIGLGGYLWWDNHQKAVAGERSEKFIVALDAVDAHKFGDGTAKLGDLAKDSNQGTRAAALVMQAAIAAEQGKAADAKRLFERVAADGSAPQPYRDLATIRAVAVQFDATPPADVVARLKPLAVPGKPWFASAAELVGMAYLKQNHADLAGPLFAAIARDKQASDTIRNRSRQMAALLGVDAIDDVARAAGTQPGDM